MCSVPGVTLSRTGLVFSGHQPARALEHHPASVIHVFCAPKKPKRGDAAEIPGGKQSMAPGAGLEAGGLCSPWPGMEPRDGESKHGNFPEEEEEEENELLPSGAKATRHLGERGAEFAGGTL